MNHRVALSLSFLLQLINLNTATRVELDALPGVGPVLAQRIVEFRERRDGFRRIEELLAIPGISERRWQVLKDLVTVPGDPEPEK
jgi:competence protein ComEA